MYVHNITKTKVVYVPKTNTVWFVEIEENSVMVYEELIFICYRTDFFIDMQLNMS